MKYYMRIVLSILVLFLISTQASAQNRTWTNSPTITESIGSPTQWSLNVNGANVAITPTGGTTSNTLPNLTARPGLSPLDFGAKCDGVTDDTTSLTNWAAAIVSGVHAVLPNSTCVYKSALTFPAVNNWSLDGVGPQSRLLYAGATTTGTIVTFGSASTSSSCAMTDFKMTRVTFFSNTVMTGGTGVMLGHICDADIESIRVGEQFVNGNWYNAVQIYAGNGIHINDYAFYGQNIGEVASGDTASHNLIDLYQSHGLISHSGYAGLNIAGSCGGCYFESTDVILNQTYNTIIDQSVSGSPNLQIFFGAAFYNDATTGAGNSLYLNDAGNSTSILNIDNGWTASAVAGSGSQGVCFLISSAVANYRINFTGGTITNCHNDGMQINSSSASLYINLTGVEVSSNTGYGVNNSGGITHLQLNGIKFFSNTSGDINGASQFIGNNLGNATNNAGLWTQSGYAKIGVAGDCGIWVGGHINGILPADPAASTAGCSGGSPPIGNGTYPFGNFYSAGGVVARGTAPTNSGSCAVTSQVGGATAGRFQASGACASGTLVFSMPTSAFGWACKVNDHTTPADVMNQTATSSTSVTFTGSMANNDIVSFFCEGF